MKMGQEYVSNLKIVNQNIQSDSADTFIEVFTSNACPFCTKTLEIVNQVVQSMTIYDPPIQVIERDVEENLDRTERHNILAVPFILIGDSSIVGLPGEDEVKELIHQAMLAEAFKKA